MKTVCYSTNFLSIQDKLHSTTIHLRCNSLLYPNAPTRVCRTTRLAPKSRLLAVVMVIVGGWCGKRGMWDCDIEVPIDGTHVSLAHDFHHSGCRPPPPQPLPATTTAPFLWLSGLIQPFPHLLSYPQQARRSPYA